eukprot:5651303-Amphidinium_carterae.2
MSSWMAKERAVSDSMRPLHKPSFNGGTPRQCEDDTSVHTLPFLMTCIRQGCRSKEQETRDSHS